MIGVGRVGLLKSGKKCGAMGGREVRDSGKKKNIFILGKGGVWCK